jgi:hypothetical protein
MSRMENNGYSKKCLVKIIGGTKIYLYKSFDLRHGYGYFAVSNLLDYKIGFGFHKTNKLTAIRQSFNIA